MLRRQDRQTLGSKSDVPIKGRSHYCEGYTAQGRQCTQIVRNDSDHCEAGHDNRPRDVVSNGQK